MKFKSITIFLFLFVNFVKAAELQFINNTDDTLRVKLVGWRRMYGLIYRQEDIRAIGKLQTLNWRTGIKPDIKQSVLEIYDKNNKLVYKLDIKPNKNGISVSAGYTRVIIYTCSGFYEDIYELSGKKVSDVIRFGVDFLEKSSEFIIDIVYKVFSLQRKIIRDVKSIINPVLYDIIHNDKYAKKDAQVRIGGSVACQQEKQVFNERKKIVKKAQEDFLNIKFDAAEKPLVIAFVASGGGQRALLCTLGSSLGAEQIGLLDCGTYLSTLSGSTWFLAPWMLSGLSLSEIEKRVVEQAKQDLIFKDADIAVDVKRIFDQLQIKFAFNQPIGFADIYGAFLAKRYLDGLGINGDPNRCYLSSLADMKKMNSGESLIPIFTAVTAEAALGHTWCEFTPWEFGSREFGATGAHIPVWAFGRKFDSLKSTKNWGTKSNPLYESMQTLGFLMGIWGSAPAANLKQMYDQAFYAIENIPVKAALEIICKKTDFKKMRFVWADINNFMNKSSISIFSQYKYLKLADAGIKFINPIFSTYRRPAEGKNIKDGSAPDVIVIWDSGAEESGVNELKMQSEYAKKHKHAFPVINLAASDKSIINIFTQNPDKAKYKDYEVPTVIYMKKRLDKELLLKYSQDPVFKDIVVGLNNFNLQDCMKDTCKTFNFKYDKAQDGVLISKLLIDMTKFNVMVSADKIKEALRKRLYLNRVRDGIATGAVGQLAVKKESLEPAEDKKSSMQIVTEKNMAA